MSSEKDFKTGDRVVDSLFGGEIGEIVGWDDKFNPIVAWPGDNRVELISTLVKYDPKKHTTCPHCGEVLV